MRKKTKGIYQEIVLYVLTVIGVLMSKWIPFLKDILGGSYEPEIEVSWLRLGVSALLGLVITFLVEKDGDAEGKMKNFKRRAVNHLAYGAFWFVLIEELL